MLFQRAMERRKDLMQLKSTGVGHKFQKKKGFSKRKRSDRDLGGSRYNKKESIGKENRALEEEGPRDTTHTSGKFLLSGGEKNG